MATKSNGDSGGERSVAFPPLLLRFESCESLSDALGTLWVDESKSAEKSSHRGTLDSPHGYSSSYGFGLPHGLNSALGGVGSPFRDNRTLEQCATKLLYSAIDVREVLEREITKQMKSASSELLSCAVKFLRERERQQNLPTSREKLVGSLSFLDKKNRFEVPTDIVIAALIQMGFLNVTRRKEKSNGRGRGGRQGRRGRRGNIQRGGRRQEDPQKIMITRSENPPFALQPRSKETGSSEPRLLTSSEIIPCILGRATEWLSRLDRRSSKRTLKSFRKEIRSICNLRLSNVGEEVVSWLENHGLVLSWKAPKTEKRPKTKQKSIVYALYPRREKRSQSLKRGMSFEFDDNPSDSSRMKTDVETVSTEVAMYRWSGGKMGKVAKKSLIDFLSVAIKPEVYAEHAAECIEKGIPLGNLLKEFPSSTKLTPSFLGNLKKGLEGPSA